MVRPIRSVGGRPYQEQCVDCSEEISLLGHDQKARAHVRTNISCECPWHGPAIMGDQNTTFAGCQSENIQVREKAEACRGCGLKINQRLATQEAGNNIFVEVGVCLEAYLHGFRRWLTSSIFLDSSSFLCRLGFARCAWARNASNSRSCSRR